MTDNAKMLLERIESLLDPLTGLCRGMVLNTDKPHDKPQDIFPTTVAELLNVKAVLRECVSVLRDVEPGQ